MASRVFIVLLCLVTLGGLTACGKRGALSLPQSGFAETAKGVAHGPF